MKKHYLLFIALVLSMPLFGQVDSESDLLLEQGMDTPFRFENFIDKNENSIILVDDFIFDKEVYLTSLKFYGNTASFGVTLDMFLEKYNGGRLYIFEDNNGFPKGKPSTASKEAYLYKEIDKDDEALAIKNQEGSYGYTVSIDLVKLLGKEVKIEANKKYWITYVPIQDIQINPDEETEDYSYVWGWYLSKTNFEGVCLIDEKDLVGAGFINWVKVNEVGLGIDGFDSGAMEIYGKGTLGNNEVYSTVDNSFYPNPVTDMVYFKNSENLEKVEIFDMTGRIIKSFTSANIQNINLGSLKNGVYLIKQYYKNGKNTTSKLMKK